MTLRCVCRTITYYAVTTNTAVRVVFLSINYMATFFSKGLIIFRQAT